jgi:hypothetical protein
MMAKFNNDDNKDSDNYGGGIGYIDEEFSYG